MTTEVLAQQLLAGVTAFFGQGRIWYIKTGASAVTVVSRSSGSGAKVRKFVNVGAGFKFTAEVGDGWDILEVTSAVNQAFEIIIGDDDVEVSNAVSITGVALVQTAPYTGFSSPATITVNNGAAATYAASTRKVVVISNQSISVGSIFLQVSGGGAATGVEIQPGTNYSHYEAGTFDLRNDSGGPCSVGFVEYN